MAACICGSFPNPDCTGEHPSDFEPVARESRHLRGRPFPYGDGEHEGFNATPTEPRPERPLVQCVLCGSPTRFSNDVCRSCESSQQFREWADHRGGWS